MQNLKKKTNKNPSIQFQLFVFYKSAFLQKNLHGPALSIRAFSTDGHSGLLYNIPSYSRILIGSRLWSIRGQTHDWRHHNKVFPSAVLKWRKVLRIRIIFYVTAQKIRYKKVLPRHWTGSRSQKMKDKPVSFRKWYRNNFLAASVGSRARLNYAQTWSW